MSYNENEQVIHMPPWTEKDKEYYKKCLGKEHKPLLCEWCLKPRKGLIFCPLDHVPGWYCKFCREVAYYCDECIENDDS